MGREASRSAARAESVLGRSDFGRAWPCLPLQHVRLVSTLCVFQGLPSSTLAFTRAFIAFGALSWRRLETLQALQPPSAFPTTGRRGAGPLQPKVHDPPQRDHGRGVVLSDARRAKGRGGRPRRARGAGILLSSIASTLRAQATPRPTTRTSSSTRTTRTAWCTASEARGRPPRWA